MIRTKSSSDQLVVFDPFLPEELKGLPGDLGAIDAFLDDEAFLRPYRGYFDPQRGRPSIPIETYLRMMYLKFSHGLGYETLTKQVSDSFAWRRFCRIGIADPVPHPTTLLKITKRVGPAVVDALNCELGAKARAQKLIRGRTLRVDTTVIEADVSHPTDAGLLARGVGAIGRAVRRIKAAGGAARTVFVDRRRAAGKRMRALTGGLRTRTEEGKAKVNRLTKQLSVLARQASRDAKRVARNAQRALGASRSNGRLRRALEELKELIRLTHRVLAQTALRLGGTTTIPDRLVSLSDPDARPIKRGKLSHPVEFGYKVMLADGKEGFIEDYQLFQGNPPDHDLIAGCMDRYIAQTGRAPRTLTADRGFGIERVDELLKEIGITTVAIPRRGRVSDDRKKVEFSPQFRRLVKWRTGCEGRISSWKRGYGGRRTRFKGTRGSTTWVGFGVLAHNLDKVARSKRKPR